VKTYAIEHKKQGIWEQKDHIESPRLGAGEAKTKAGAGETAQ